jgi:hypothetical protein
VVTRKLRIEDLGGDTVRTVVPMRAKGSSRWAPAERPVAYFPALGETAEDAETFADALNASYIAWRRAEDDRIGSIGYDETLAPVARGPVPTAAERKRIEKWHAERAAAVRAWSNPARLATADVRRLRDDRGLAELVERFAAMRSPGKVAARGGYVRQAGKVAAAISQHVSGPVAVSLADEPRVSFPSAPAGAPDTSADDLNYSYRESVREMLADREPDREPDPETSRRDDAGEPDRDGTAVAHDFGDPCDCGACADPEAVPPEPTHPYRFDDTIRHPGASRIDCADCYEQDAPAPALTVVPTPEPTAPSAGRPTCPRCGQTFRKSGTGYAWHLANRPDCAASRTAVAA